VTASARLSWNLRVTPEDQAVIDRAVSASGLTRTDFVLQPAHLAGQELLIEQTWLSVGAEPFERFAPALDAPMTLAEILRAVDEGCRCIGRTLTNYGRAHFKALASGDNPAFFIPARSLGDIF